MVEKEENIVQIIQEMIKEGQSEQTIIENLKELGVPPQKAKKLLLVGQADVYSVLQSEISRMLDKKLLEKRPDMLQNIQSELKNAEENTAQAIKEKTAKELKDYEKYLENKLLIIESQVNSNVQKALTTSDKIRDKLLADEGRIRRLETTGGTGEGQAIPHRTANLVLAGLGVIFAIVTAGIFYLYASTAISTEAMIIGVVMGLISVTMMFVSTIL